MTSSIIFSLESLKYIINWSYKFLLEIMLIYWWQGFLLLLNSDNTLRGCDPNTLLLALTQIFCCVKVDRDKRIYFNSVLKILESIAKTGKTSKDSVITRYHAQQKIIVGFIILRVRPRTSMWLVGWILKWCLIYHNK